MSYDAARAVTFLFGGSRGGDENWEWNGTAWTQRSLASPSARYGHAMAYAAGRAATILFGGLTSSGANGETWELGMPCTSPSITAQPAAQTVCPAGPASFSIAAGGIGPLVYQWQIESPAGSGVFVPVIGPTFTEPATGLTFSVSGQATNTLRVSRITLGTHPRTIRFCAAVSNTCGTVTSGTALLTVCKADLDCDGFASGDDYGIFVAWFEMGDLGADFDGDGFLTGDDFQLFVEAFEAGC